MKTGNAFKTSILWRGIYFVSVLLLNILVARHFKAEGSGQIFYIVNLFSFFVILLSFSLEVPMGFYLSQKKLSETQLGITSVAWVLLVMIPVSFLIHYFGKGIALPLKEINFTISAIAFLAGNLLISFFVALFYAKLDFILPNILLVAVNLFLITVIPANETIKNYLNNTEYINLYFIGFLLQGFLLAIAFFIRYVKWTSPFFLPKEILKPFFYFAAVVLLTNFLSFLMSRIDYFFVNKYCLPSDLGNYIQACKLAQLFFVLPAILAGVIFPLTASGRKIETNDNIQVLSRGLILIYGFACLILVITGRWLFPFLFGESFTKMYLPFVLLIPAILSYSVIHLLAAYFGGKKVLSIGFLGNILTLSLIVVGDILFIPTYGIAAAAIVSSTGYLFLMLFMIYAHIRTYKSSIKDFLLFRRSDWHLLQKTIAQALFLRKKDEL